MDQRYDPDKRMTLAEEFIADLDPNDTGSVFRITGIDSGPPLIVHFEPGSTGRVYSLRFTDNPKTGVWTMDAGTPPRHGVGGPDSMTDTNNAPIRLHQIHVELP